MNDGREDGAATRSYDREQLRALAAVLDEGSFEVAVAALHVTPSAVSQRIRALEHGVGRVLVVRARPCRATDDGAVLARLAGQVALLERDTASALRGAAAGDGWVRLPVAVNADSLSTWFTAALRDLPEGVLLDLRREDQDVTASLLRDGTVTAAVTADPRAVQGCRVRPLGSMRYVAVASRDYRERWFADGGLLAAGWAGLRSAPAVSFNRQDALQHRFAARLVGQEVDPPMHHVPSNAAFLEVLRAGLGWGMVPEQALASVQGSLVALVEGADTHLDVPLYWQHWSLRTPTLDAVTAAVVQAASVALRACAPPSPPRSEGG